MSSQPNSPLLPDWITSGVEEYNGWIAKTVAPYPYQHPDNLDDYVCLHQNDYLRMSARPEVRKAKIEAIENYGNSYLASTVFTGGRGMEEHQTFRAQIADAMQTEDAILASSGWAANVGLIEVLAKRDTPIYLDQRAHASLWDGAQLSQGRPIMVRHNDPESLERRILRDGAGIVCIDSFYSITGSVADVAAYVDVCERTGSVLILDEAHSFGMVGYGAGGLAVEAGVAERVHFRTTSFSKGLGGHGGCIAASHHLTWLLTHRAHSILFSSSALPCDSAAHRTALSIARAEPWLGSHTLEMGALLRQELSLRGIDTGTSACQIVPIGFESEQLACRFYQILMEHGVLSAVFLSPAVPLGKGVVRFSTHSQLKPEEVVRAADAAAAALDELGIARRAKQRAA
jgi:CAI-1 autoinducer synthase